MMFGPARLEETGFDVDSAELFLRFWNVDVLRKVGMRRGERGTAIGNDSVAAGANVGWWLVIRCRCDGIVMMSSGHGLLSVWV